MRIGEKNNELPIVSETPDEKENEEEDGKSENKNVFKVKRIKT
jgi:hypothetical protein